MASNSNNQTGGGGPQSKRLLIDCNTGNLAFVEVTRQHLRTFFPETVRMLSGLDFTPGEVREIFDLGLPPMVNYEEYYRRAGEPAFLQFWDKIRQIWKVPQDDPVWLARAKVIPGLISASNGDKFAQMTHGACARRLKLSQGMIVDKAKFARDPAWDEFALRLLSPRVPGRPLDALSHAFTNWGSRHENNALAVFMHNSGGRYIYEDRGLCFYTPEILAKQRFRNLLTGEVILALPFLLCASPDGILTDTVTGVKINCEWKAAAACVPGGGDWPAGASFDFKPGTKPYEQIKAYYVPQVMQQMVACGTTSAIFGCFTYGCGMNLWRVDFNRELVEVMITIMLHIYDTFVRGRKPGEAGVVPVDYMAPGGSAPAPVKALYLRMEAIVADIVKNTHPYSAIDPDTCRQTIDTILGHAHPPVARRVQFPECEFTMPPYIRLAVYARYFLPAPQPKAPPGPGELLARRLQLLAFVNMDADCFFMGGADSGNVILPLTLGGTSRPLEFMRPVVDAILRGDARFAREMLREPARSALLARGIDPVAAGRYVEAHQQLQMGRMTAAEQYVLELVEWLYQQHTIISAISMPDLRQELLVGACEDLAHFAEVTLPAGPGASYLIAERTPDRPRFLQSAALHLRTGSAAGVGSGEGAGAGASVSVLQYAWGLINAAKAILPEYSQAVQRLPGDFRFVEKRAAKRCEEVLREDETGLQLRTGSAFKRIRVAAEDHVFGRD